MTEIYQPAEDSYFFAEFLEKYLSETKINSYLDMGTGSTVLSRGITKFLNKKDILVADINSSAIKSAKKEGFNAIQTNLFEKIKGKFDLITFNAPYLPEDPREPKSSQMATTGGKRGDEISLKFLISQHLKKFKI